MSREESVAVEDLREDDAIDLTPVLEDPLAEPWIHQPFGPDGHQLREAVKAARIAARYERAQVESVETRPDGSVAIYSDQMNVTVPAGYRILRTVI